MKTVSINFREPDLERLDAWADSKRLKRNAAILALLDIAMAAGATPSVSRPGGSGAYLKDIKLSLGKKVLNAAQDYVGASRVSVDGDAIVEDWPADPEAQQQFYGKKQVVEPLVGQKVPRQEEVSQDPEDW